VQLLVVLRIAQQRLDPRLVGRVRGQILLEEELTEQQADTDVCERAEGKDPMGELTSRSISGSSA
jgi:hypothetical protein